jgi:plastocyanin
VGRFLKGITMKSLFATIAFLVAAQRGALADGKISGTVEAKPSKFLKDTIVYVKSVPDAKLTAKTFEIDQQGMAFSPHIALVAVGDTVKFQNHDKVDHNVMSSDGGYDLGTWGTGQDKSHQFTKEGVYAQVCKLHPEMLAYVFVGQNRFAATVDDQGRFTIAGVPAGTYELVVWNPKLKAASQKVTVTDAGATAKFSLAR